MAKTTNGRILTLEEANQIAGDRATIIRDSDDPTCWAVLYGDRRQCAEVHEPMSRGELEALLGQIGA